MSQYKGELTEKQAIARFAHFANNLKNLSYDIFLKYNKGQEYSGKIHITCDLVKVSSEFFIDWSGSEVSSLSINGNPVASSDNYASMRKGVFFFLPQDQLKVGQNEIIIEFKNNYASDGCGLHSFIDTDNRQYTYTDFEPFFANRFIPCFDQPDLKAPYTLIAAIPNEWNMVSNSPTNAEKSQGLDKSKYLTEAEQSTHQLIAFDECPRISSYLYCCCAGEYKIIESKKTHNGIAMKYFARESLMPFLTEQAEEIFDAHIKAIAFYEEFFGMAYPFKKCDGVFCPDYNFGAMENVGCITYNDNYIFKEKNITVGKRSKRYHVIYHELAHQWFGNLVTMKWWNGLWLNESFADIAAYFSLKKTQNQYSQQIEDSWLAFNRRKEWGYTEDQYKTTHPIAGDVVDTEQALAIFDGITYSKGASALKNLICLIGEQNFSKALQSYFKLHAWSNTTLDDFISAMNEFYEPIYPNSPKNLIDWQKSWLQTSGLNECQAEWDPSNTNSEAKLVIKQTAARPDFPNLRHHKVKVAFYNAEGTVCEIKDVVLNDSAETAITYNGANKPKAVFLNHDDDAFIKVILDEHSLEFFKKELSKISGELNKSLIWTAFSDMIKDGKLSAYEAAQTISAAVVQENSDSVLTTMISQFHHCLNYSPVPLRKDYVQPLLFESFKKALLQADKSNKNRQAELTNAVISAASYSEKRQIDNIQVLIQWLEGTHPELKEIELEIVNKWSIVFKLCTYPLLSNSSKTAYMQKLADVDPSDTGKKNKRRFEVSLGTSEEREKAWNSILDKNDKTPLKEQQSVMVGYLVSPRYEASSDEKKFFDAAEQVFRDRDSMFAKAYFRDLFPKGDNVLYYMERLRQLEALKINAFSIKLVGEKLDEVERLQKAYGCCANDLLRLEYGINI